MIYQTEAKLQGWRALVVFEDRSECLLYVGRSTTQVRAGYAAAYAEVLDDEERGRVRSISLQCWQGASDKGHWVTKGTLSVPGRKPLTVSADLVRTKLAVAASEAEAESLEEETDEPTPTILPFPGAAAEAEESDEQLPLVHPRRKAQATTGKQPPPREASMLA
jgi:hypothetical protein